MKRCFQIAFFLACFSLAAHGQLPSCLTPIPNNMTSNTAPSPYVASASTATNPAWESFDGSNATWWLGNNNGVDWLQRDLGSAYVVVGYWITSVSDVPTRSPKTWSVLVSNDSTFATYTTLDSETSAPAWSATETRKYYNFTNSTAYRYIRINITANEGAATYTGFAELNIYYVSSSGMCVLQNGNTTKHLVNSPITRNTVTATLLLATTITKSGVCTGADINPPTTVPSTLWTCLTNYSSAVVAACVEVQICYADAPTTDPAQVFNTNTNDSFYEFYALRGTLATSDVYQVGSDHGAGCKTCLSLAAGSVTPKQNNALVFSVWGDDGVNLLTIGVPALVYSDGCGLDSRAPCNNANFPNGGIAFTLNATTLPVNPTWTETVSGASRDMAVAEAVFCSSAPCGGLNHRGYVVNSQ